MGKKNVAPKSGSENGEAAAKGAVEERVVVIEAPAESEAQAAYASRKAAWKVLGGAELGPPRVNLAYVTAKVIQIGAALSEPATLASFDALAKVPLPGGAKYDAGAVRLLPVVGRALWYARLRYLSADAQSTTVSLPPALVTEATKLRGKMFKVVEYNCVDEEDPDDLVAADLASIEAVQGPRFLDLATDLSRLAVYYHSPKWLLVLQADTRRFKAKDALRADQLAAEILEKLHQRADDAASWLLEIYRGWAELQATYDEARRGASFVYWSDLDAHMPALGALRPPVSARKAASEKKPAEPEKKPA